MKKTFILGALAALLLMPTLAAEAHYEHEWNHDVVAPVVSITVGNVTADADNTIVDGGTFTGSIPVYATVSDTNLQTYHFRVVKDGNAWGHTCDDLFADENQGYASTTLGHDACGFVFNQSVYASAATGFSNQLIATLNASDIAAFGGDGKYWLVIGGLDLAGNRTAHNYLGDPRIAITIDTTATATATSTGSASTSTPATPATTTPAAAPTGTSGSSGHHQSSVMTAGVNSSNGTYVIPNTSEAPSKQGAPAVGGSVSAGGTSHSVSASSGTSTATTTSDLTAAAGLSGVSLGWWWIVILLAAIGGGYYVWNARNI